MVSKTLFSSATGNWSTPQALFNRLDAEFHFTVDVAADAANTKCPLYFDIVTNGLAQSWAGHVWWCNPPYGRSLAKWTTKAVHESVHSVGVMLLPARTDTQWFHRDVLEAAELRFIQGRLHFGGALTAAPFPSCLAIFRPRLSRPLPLFSVQALTLSERGVYDGRLHSQV